MPSLMKLMSHILGFKKHLPDRQMCKQSERRKSWKALAEQHFSRTVNAEPLSWVRTWYARATTGSPGWLKSSERGNEHWALSQVSLPTGLIDQRKEYGVEGRQEGHLSLVTMYELLVHRPMQKHMRSGLGWLIHFHPSSTDAFWWMWACVINR